MGTVFVTQDLKNGVSRMGTRRPTKEFGDTLEDVKSNFRFKEKITEFRRAGYENIKAVVWACSPHPTDLFLGSFKGGGGMKGIDQKK